VFVDGYHTVVQTVVVIDVTVSYGYVGDIVVIVGRPVYCSVDSVLILVEASGYC